MILEDDLHLAEFCRSARPRLEALARFLTKGSGIDAEDLTQDTLHVFVHKWKNGMTVADPEKYADGILRKLAKRAIQKSLDQRRRQVPLEEAEDPPLPDIAHAAEDRAKYELLRNSVAAVENRRQRIFLTWALEGASIPEIAEREFKESGRQSSAHQVSCVLERGRGQLSLNYKRRGGWRMILPPLPLLGGLRRKIDQLGPSVIDATHSASFTALVNAIVGVFLLFPVAGSIEPTVGEATLNSSRPSAATSEAFPVSTDDGAVEIQSAIGLGQSGQSPGQQLGDQNTGARMRDWEETSSPPPGPEAWITDLVAHPERLLPECGGLPVCGSP